jgi:hypothetical protein
LDSKSLQLSPVSKRTGHFTFREHELQASIDNITLPSQGLDANQNKDSVKLLADVQTFIDS